MVRNPPALKLGEFFVSPAPDSDRAPVEEY
jgi:hypothetical protein